MLHLLNVTRRMAVIDTTGGSSVQISRSKADGSTFAMLIHGKWKTIDTQEMLDALSWVTLTNDELKARGAADADLKPKRKRDYKAEYARRKERKELKERADFEHKYYGIF